MMEHLYFGTRTQTFVFFKTFIWLARLVDYFTDSVLRFMVVEISEVLC